MKVSRIQNNPGARWLSLYGHKKKKCFCVHQQNASHRGLEQWSKQVYVNETQYRLLFIHKTQNYLPCTYKVTLLPPTESRWSMYFNSKDVCVLFFNWSRQQLFIKRWSITTQNVSRLHFQHFKEMIQVPVSQWTNSAKHEFWGCVCDATLSA